jgi:putative phage-type endonuclease
MPRLTKEELATRRLGMGSTDVVEALGLAPWEGAGPMRLYLEKTSEGPPLERDEEALSWGHIQEPVILDWYRDARRPCILGAQRRHDRLDWLWASIDAHSSDGDRLVEIKNVSSHMAWHWDAYSEDGIPRYVRAQVMIGMACSGHRLADVVASVGGRAPHVWTVAYDEELARLLIDGAAEFWHKVQTRTPPALDATPATKEYLRRTYPSNVDRVMGEAWEAAELVAARRIRAARAEKEAKSAKDIADATLLEMVGDKDGMIGDGWKLTWKVNSAGKRVQRFTAKGDAANGEE